MSRRERLEARAERRREWAEKRNAKVAAVAHEARCAAAGGGAMTLQAKHTPTPWKIEHDSTGRVVVLDTDDTAFQLAICGKTGNARAEANAALIVRAVNAHEALVEALTDCVCSYSCGRYGPIPEGWLPKVKNTVLAARAALALAEGGPR